MACKRCLICADFSPDSDQNTFYWRKCYYGLCIHILIKNILMMDLFHLLSSQDINWWTGVVWITCGLLWYFYQLFGLSFWWHPFTAEHPLLRQWCNATFLQTWCRNKLIYILDGLRMRTFLANFVFWVNYSFVSDVSSKTQFGLVNLAVSDIDEMSSEKAVLFSQKTSWEVSICAPFNLTAV